MQMHACTRRQMIHRMGGSALALLGASSGLPAWAQSQPAATDSLLPPGSGELAQLMRQLAATARVRGFHSVPMTLTRPDQWDSRAMSEVLHYKGSPKMVWHNTDLGGPWLNLMRLTLNSQIWAFGHPDILLVSVTHGSAGLALFDQAAWDKYDFPRLTKGHFKRNTFIDVPPAALARPVSPQNPVGPFSAKASSVTVLQRRGVVFLACHDGIWGLAGMLRKKHHNPQGLSQPELAADLSNHLIPGVILTPDVVGELVELEQAGFLYAHS